jgi:hypothetical protein
MEREICEKLILNRLDEIREICNEYSPELVRDICIAVFADHVSLFALKRDEKGNPMPGEYIVDAAKFYDEVSA